VADVVSTETRSRIMAAVPHRDTKPERVVRRLLHAMGYRFRLHRKDLPGTPDIVLPKHRVAIFVHGCFWHQHPECRKARRPSSNCAYWDKKLDENVIRDRRNLADLESKAWHPMIVWQCELKDCSSLAESLRLRIEAMNPMR